MFLKKKKAILSNSRNSQGQVQYYITSQYTMARSTENDQEVFSSHI